MKHHSNHALYKDVEKIKSALAGTAFDLKDATVDALSQSVENVKDKSTQLRDDLASYTAKKPFKSLGISLCIGFLLGYLSHK